MATQIENCFFILVLCDVFVCSPPFEQAFSQAGEADIQDYVHAQNVIAGFFCTPFIIIITVRRAFVQTGLVHQPLFRYVSRLFVGNLGVYKASMLCSDA